MDYTLGDGKWQNLHNKKWKAGKLDVEEVRRLEYNKNKPNKEQLKQEYKTIREIKNKNWSDSFKEKAIGNYYKFKESGFECSVHFISRFGQRKDGDVTVDKVIEILKGPVIFIEIQNNNNIRFYDLLRVVTNENDDKVITVMKNKVDISETNIKKGKWVKK